MPRSIRVLPVVALLCSSVCALAQVPDYARDPHQPIDEAYTAAIRKYTTEPYFNSPLTDYLPASKTVPTPAKVLGDVAGAPDMLPYAEDVYKYFRLLAAVITARAGLHHRPDRRRPRDDRSRHRRRIAPRPAEGERRAPGASSPIRAPSIWTTPRPRRSSPPPRPSTTSPAPSTRRRPARPPR